MSSSGGDTAWVLAASALVGLMTPGLAFFYGGLVESNSVLNTLMMSFVCAALVTIQWLLVGYSLAFGGGSLVVGGGTFIFLRDVGTLPNALYSENVPFYAIALYQLMFAILTPALISGAVIGRMRFRTWVVFVLLWTTLVYDFVAHSVWSRFWIGSASSGEGKATLSGGWLRNLGALDFAGGAPVHITAGFSALVASLVIGQRTSSATSHRAHNVPFVLLGTALLTFGWFGFNGGATWSTGGIAALACLNSSIASASGFLTWTFMEFAYHSKFSAVGAAMGTVAGLVTITPACGYVSPMSAIAIASIGAISSFYGIRLKSYLGADDALDVFACHGVGGFVGTVLTGCFASLDLNPAGGDGLFFGNPRLLGIQLVAAISVAVYASLATYIILSVLKHVPHLGLRPSAEEEAAGLDLADHGAAAYMAIAAASVLHRSMQLRGINTSAVLRRSLTASPAASTLAATIEEEEEEEVQGDGVARTNRGHQVGINVASNMPAASASRRLSPSTAVRTLNAHVYSSSVSSTSASALSLSRAINSAFANFSSPSQSIGDSNSDLDTASVATQSPRVMHSQSSSPGSPFGWSAQQLAAHASVSPSPSPNVAIHSAVELSEAGPLSFLSHRTALGASCHAVVAPSVAVINSESGLNISVEVTISGSRRSVFLSTSMNCGDSDAPSE